MQNSPSFLGTPIRSPSSLLGGTETPYACTKKLEQQGYSRASHISPKSPRYLNSLFNRSDRTSILKFGLKNIIPPRGEYGILRAVDPGFRKITLARYNQHCPISGVDHPGLLDVAHALSWRDYPEYRADLSNVITLSKTHHAAFDRELYTIDADYRLLVNPTFETQSDLLKRTILDNAGERLPLLVAGFSSDYLAQHNAGLEWV
ncbi:HNH endonuclease [Haladaptatus sp. ZSTT2]|uniref:HNH endonuclease n=1 Tax=Haladaptatus sp. ZSTT2 TaxID=3120515 RepID=UPI00300E9AC5